MTKKTIIQRILISLIALMTMSSISMAFDIKPTWRKNDKFIYEIIQEDGKLKKDGQIYSVKTIYNVSFTVLEVNQDSYTIEWKYLPVQQPIQKCFSKKNEKCYSYYNDIKQKIRLVFILDSNGTYQRTTNSDEMISQISSCIETYIKNKKKYKDYDHDALKKLTTPLIDSVVYDDSVFNELLEYNLIYGNSVRDKEIDDSSYLVSLAQHRQADFKSQVLEESEWLLIDFNMENDTYQKKDSYIKTSKHSFHWTLNKENMVIEKMEKIFKSTTKDGDRFTKLEFNRIL